MAKYLVTVAYDGTSYCGWQSQKHEEAIQDIITAKLRQIFNQPELKIFGSGRTDAGVHARGQTFHFVTKKEFDLNRLIYSLNVMLPEDIQILKIKTVDQKFHARLSAKSKHYRYIISTGPGEPFKYRHRYEIKRPLDVKKMKVAITALVGEHNFLSFTNKQTDFQKYVRTIFKADITENNEEIIIDFIGNGFMRSQVRLMVGTLIEIGLLNFPEDTIKKLLQKPSFPPRVPKAPAQGLYLMEVFYE
ncbi:MAG: tRNA pseudouridine(38-40) synthase TruA [Bacilli bacterium]|jgi:tRNA pseudouridine38-40 synthase